MAETAPKPILHHGHIGHGFTVGRYVCSEVRTVFQRVFTRSFWYSSAFTPYPSKAVAPRLLGFVRKYEMCAETTTGNIYYSTED